ncbi:MAG: hypothetical protein Q4C71_02590 [Microbacteriaceae bacterium]|nr:hypothetical protein [Microbacteriaceae bacterium]
MTGADLTYMHEVCEQDGYDAMFADTLHGLSTATIPLPRDLWEQCRSYVEGDELDDLLAIPILDD